MRFTPRLASRRLRRSLGDLVAAVDRVSWQDRQDDGEGAAFAGCALQQDAPGMRLDDPLDEAEPETGALDLRRDHAGRAVERIEHFGLVARRDADAAIADAHFDSAPGA